MSDLAEVPTVVDRLGSLAARDADLAPLTTYKVGGRAAALVRAESASDLEAVASAIDGAPVPVLVIGRGSNLLVHDDGFPGVVVVLGAGFEVIDITDTRVVAGGAASLPVVARRTAAAGLTGFEWAVGVPGSMGGAVRMNAGGHGSDMARTVVAVDTVDLRSGRRARRGPDSLAFAYRRSAIGDAEVVVSVALDLAVGDRASAEAEIAEIVRWRREHQPGGHNAGSVFVNPSGDSAGRLIEAAGCKGLRRGTAEVSPKHANFIQADDGGRATDVHALMVEVQTRVRDHAGVTLRPETRLVGFPDLPDDSPEEHAP